MYLYTPKYRPPAFSVLPKGYELVETPQGAGYNRPDLPASRHRFGVVGWNNKLTSDDAERYELRYLGKMEECSTNQHAEGGTT